MSRTPLDSHNAQEDKSLIIQIRSGDYAAFTLLYNKDIHYSVKSYLFKSVRTSVLHWLRKQHRLRPLPAGEENGYSFELQLSPETLVLDNEHRQLVRRQIERVLGRLIAKQKEVIYLRYLMMK